MAVLPQFGGLAEAHMRALVMRDSASGALLGNNGGYPYQHPQYDNNNNNNNCAAVVVSAAQSELTCNGGGCGGVVLPSRKRGRDQSADRMAEQYVSSSSALLPVPGMLMKEVVGQLSPPAAPAVVDPAGMTTTATSTSGRAPAAAECSSVTDVLVAELCRQGVETDALVRAECERLRAGLEQARKRQRQALARAVAGAAERRLRETEAELGAARRRAAELEERVRQAAAESQAWCGLARSHEAVAAGLRATLDHLLLRAGGAASTPVVEGFGESDGPVLLPSGAAGAAADDAQSPCCFVAATDKKEAEAASSSSPGGARKWACKACGEHEASVLLLPCRHLCACKACEPRLDACPVCLAVKNASIHVAES